MDIQAMMDAMDEQRQVYARFYGHMTIGQVITELEALGPEQLIPGLSHTVDSYRGYYIDLSIEPDAAGTTAGELLKSLRDAIAPGRTFTGYKGGEFTMTKDTLVWVAEYGRTGHALMGFHDGIPVTRRQEAS